MLWTMPLTFPLMAAVQSICGRIGRVTVTALAFNVKQSFPAWVAMTAVALLLIAHPSRSAPKTKYRNPSSTPFR
jgi:Mn2+/Fe2+ NRAMP family transporter